MTFLVDATAMDPRFKGKVPENEVWERVMEAAVREVSNH